MYALKRNGKEIWTLPTGNMIWTAAAISYNSKWMVFGSLNKKLYLVDPETGKLFSTRKLKGEIKSSPAIDRNNNIYVGTSGARLYSYGIKRRTNDKGYTFDKRWVFKTDGEIYSICPWSSVIKSTSVKFSAIPRNLASLSFSASSFRLYSVMSVTFPSIAIGLPSLSLISTFR